MLKWLTEYQEEDFNRKTIALATFINPRFRGRVFTLHYAPMKLHCNYSLKTLTMILWQNMGCVGQPHHIKKLVSLMSLMYLDGQLVIQAKLQFCNWKSIFNNNTQYKETNPPCVVDGLSDAFPFLSMCGMANLTLSSFTGISTLFTDTWKALQNYLATFSTSCECKRTVLNSAKVCTPSQGSMLPKTAERLCFLILWPIFPISLLYMCGIDSTIQFSLIVLNK